MTENTRSRVLNQVQARELILNSGGKPFTAVFIKRTTGELRTMLCRFGVPSPKGGKAAYNFESKGLVCVFDEEKQLYRSIPIDGLLKLVVDGVEFPILRPQQGV